MHGTICRHPGVLKVIKPTAQWQCPRCNVWKGRREDPHFYGKEYWQRPNYYHFTESGIPRRQRYYDLHTEIWQALTIPLEDLTNVLEIGAGLGFLAYTFHRTFHTDSHSAHQVSMTALEQSSWAATFMQETYGQYHGFRILEGNFEFMDPVIIGKEKDFIYACHVWEHLADPMSAMEKVYELLKPDGYFYLEVPSQQMERQSHHDHNWAYSLETLRLWAEQCGFVAFNRTAHPTAQDFIDVVMRKPKRG